MLTSIIIILIYLINQIWIRNFITGMLMKNIKNNVFNIKHPINVFNIKHPINVFNIKHPINVFNIKHPINVLLQAPR